MHAVINTSSPNLAQKSKRNRVLNAVHAFPASLRLTPVLGEKRRGKTAAAAAAAASVAADTAFTVVMTEGSSNAIDEDTQQQLREQVNHRCGPYAAAGDARSTLTTNNKEKKEQRVSCHGGAHPNTPNPMGRNWLVGAST
eukprot:CAMPEP_0171323986 /NCGR_PEP_ID=MMETSP0816-20121228/115911_1 /TAXON_ID=420281 /ORGANISM="Proboscia inermis, Strain CCAP1064/1" /LENGTH=139 /DNA_ID=CAMNT_0011822819 /DNA_START=810 /DNA_END=1230 /DNA_ORIENTATION=+